MAARDGLSHSPSSARHPHTGHLPVHMSQGTPSLLWAQAQATWVPVIKDQRACVRPPWPRAGQRGQAGIWFELFHRLLAP